jgi:hypothetical protein
VKNQGNSAEYITIPLRIRHERVKQSCLECFEGFHSSCIRSKPVDQVPDMMDVVGISRLVFCEKRRPNLSLFFVWLFHFNSLVSDEVMAQVEKDRTCIREKIRR